MQICRINCKNDTTANWRNIFADISTSRTSVLQSGNLNVKIIIIKFKCVVYAVKFILQNDLLLEYTITQVFKVIFVSRGSVNCLTNNLFCLRVMWSGTQVCLHSLDFLLPLCTTRTMLLRKQEMSLQVSACESADQKTSG